MHTFLAIFFNAILYIIRTIRNHDYQLLYLHYIQLCSRKKERKDFSAEIIWTPTLSKLIAADIKWASKLITSNDPSGLIPKKKQKKNKEEFRRIYLI